MRPMVREVLLLMLRACVILLPLIAVHRFAMVDEPGYLRENSGGLQSLHLGSDAAWGYSLDWQTKATKLEIERVRAEIAKVAIEVEAARLIDAQNPSRAAPPSAWTIRTPGLSFEPY